MRIRASGLNSFMFRSGPARRFVGQPSPGHTAAVSALPGGTSADPTSPFYLNLLRPYLRDDYYPALLAAEVTSAQTADVTRYVPGG